MLSSQKNYKPDNFFGRTWHRNMSCWRKKVEISIFFCNLTYIPLIILLFINAGSSIDRQSWLIVKILFYFLLPRNTNTETFSRTLGVVWIIYVLANNLYSQHVKSYCSNILIILHSDLFINSLIKLQYQILWTEQKVSKVFDEISSCSYLKLTKIKAPL